MIHVLHSIGWAMVGCGIGLVLGAALFARWLSLYGSKVMSEMLSSLTVGILGFGLFFVFFFR